MIQLLLVLALIFFIGFAIKRILETFSAAPGGSPNLRRGMIWGAIILGLALAAAGRAGVIISLIGALVAAILRVLPLLIPVLLQYLPLWQRWQQQARRTASAGASAGAAGSTVESGYLRMHLDHASGNVSGEVLAGRYAGRQLSQLGREQLADLYAECARRDRDSAALLQAYLERLYGEDWAAKVGGPDEEPSAHGSDTRDSGRMSTDEALEVLGLQRGATRAEIVAAHRRLMQKLHPDRGGSDYLAAKINQAKRVLLET